MLTTPFQTCVLLASVISAHAVADEQIVIRKPYDYRESTAFRALSPESRDDLKQVVNDFDALKTAIANYMADHNQTPPDSLSQLTPKYIASLPQDPFPKSDSPLPKGGVPFQRSLKGLGYLYRFRPNNTYRAWELRSAGLPDFPLRYRNTKHSLGLVHQHGYWGRYMLDVF